MALFHLSVKALSRSKGRSAVASAAYRSGVRLTDMRLGQIFDYRRKSGILHSELVLPNDVPGWACDRESLWNLAEKSEIRKNSTVAREFEISLPSELREPQRRELALRFCNELVTRHKFAVDLAIHSAGKGGDSRNVHAHILTSTRRLSSTGFDEKCRELDNQKSGEILFWRERWATLVNEALEAASRRERVDHRSLAEQGISREPTRHQGPARTSVSRRLNRRPHVPEVPDTRQKMTSKGKQAVQLSIIKNRLAKSDVSKFIQAFKGAKNDSEHSPTPN